MAVLDGTLTAGKLAGAEGVVSAAFLLAGHVGIATIAAGCAAVFGGATVIGLVVTGVYAGTLLNLESAVDVGQKMGTFAGLIDD